jgi:glycosyltransferase involved in cell wall biosynthesis
MKHIVIDAREWSTSTGRYIRNLVRQLEQLDHVNDYTVLLKPKDINAWQPDNSNFHKLACPYKEFTFAEQLGFKKQLDGLAADLVHFGMVQQPVRYRGRVVTTMNDLTTLRFNNPAKNRFVFWFKQRVYAWVNHKVAKKSAAVLTYSQFTKDDIERFTDVPPSKITVTHLAAEPIMAKMEAVEALENKPFITYVGRAAPHKNLARLIEAFALLKGRHPDLRLVLAGKIDGNYRRLEKTAQEQAINNVVFPGFVSEGQLRWLYENCEAYVFPSLSEGFGLPGLEAMAHGAPVVSSNATCLSEIYGEAAHYFDPLDVQSMSDAINEVLTDKQLRESLVEKGRKRVQKYSWRRMAEQTLGVYKKVLGA